MRVPCCMPRLCVLKRRVLIEGTGSESAIEGLNRRTNEYFPISASISVRPQTSIAINPDNFRREIVQRAVEGGTSFEFLSAQRFHLLLVSRSTGRCRPVPSPPVNVVVVGAGHVPLVREPHSASVGCVRCGIGAGTGVITPPAGSPPT